MRQKSHLQASKFFLLAMMFLAFLVLAGKVQPVFANDLATPNPSPKASAGPLLVIYVPPTPVQFSAYVLNDDQVKLAWAACRQVSAKFRVYRSVTGASEGFTKFAETEDLNYLADFGQEKSLWFAVTAVDYSGTEGFPTYVLEVKSPRAMTAQKQTLAGDLRSIFAPLFESQVAGVKVNKSGKVEEKTTKSFFDSTGLSYLF